MFSLYGQISHAKVNLLEVRPGTSEAVVEISGIPQQTSAPILYAVLDFPPTFSNICQEFLYCPSVATFLF